MNRFGPASAVMLPSPNESCVAPILESNLEDEASVFVFPATTAQRRFWLLEQMHSAQNPALSMVIGLRWRGPMEPLLLRRALNAVVARHEALRTTFETERGQLRQVIAPVLQLDLTLAEAKGSETLDHPGVAAPWLRAEAAQPFDLAQGPLLRARLVRFGADDYLLLLAIHHIVSDGWSNGILVRDLCEAYSALLQNRAPAWPELPLQFADYADWQQTRLTNDDFAGQREYWRANLAGDFPALDLPYARTAHADSSGGETASCLLPPELVRAAKSFAAAENATPFMIFFAAFQALLHRYTGQTNFLVTSPSANRERPEFESLVGLFVNPLLVRADLRGGPNLRELLARVRTISLEAFSNQDIPFGLLLDEFQAARLQVNFHYDAGWQQRINLPSGVSLELLPAASVGTVYELSASVLEEPRGSRLELEYNPGLFDSATIARLLGHYQTLLENMLARSTQPISTLSILSADEEEHFGLEIATAPPVETLDLRALLVERVMTQPDAIVARHGRRELSCAEILARIDDRDGASELDQAAAWIAHWRARVETAPSPVRTSSLEQDAQLTAASLVLREFAGLIEHERIASFSPPGSMAAEEIGAALLANAILVYPTSDLLADSEAAFAAWLNAENISVAFLPAATWNRLASAIVARKVRAPAKLRLVIATAGNPREGTFGHVVPAPDNASGLRVAARNARELVGGTIALDGKVLPATVRRLRVLDLRAEQALPIGLGGELAIAQTDGNWKRTGELARWLPNESLEDLGAITEQEYVRGLRVDLRLTEAALINLPELRHALVRRLESELDAPLVTYVLPEVAGSWPNGNAMRQHLRKQGLPDLAIPSVFIPLREIPLRTSDGRLDLSALPALSDGKLAAAPEPVRPYLGLQLQLIAIWEDVLGVRGIGIRDDFFELGGNSLLAIRMLQRAEAACGKVILPSALFRHPTIEHLAGEIAREVIDESPSLLRVNDAGTRTPFFYLHGDLSGGGFYSLKLSRALGPEQPFYVMPPQDIRLLPAAPTIEEMAAAHLTALRAVRPRGPYVIGGFCIGGLVAFELAQQLRARGEVVEMLLIIDAAPESKVLRSLRNFAANAGKLLRWNDDETVRKFGRLAIWRARLAEGIAQNVRAQTRAAPRRICHRLTGIFAAARNRLGAHDQTTRPPTSAAIEIERDLPSAFQWASAGYRPQPYAGPLALLLSEDVIGAARNPSREWQRLAPALTVHPLPGSHLECITAHVETLAKEIEGRLEKATSGTTR
ncbi:MAG: condensation domain-containing protein [Chthoniobacterales bacterium]